MIIPTKSECVNLMRRAGMPAHIQKHCLMVAEITMYLGRLLNQNSLRLNLGLLEAGALLHDIAKAQSLFTGERHDELGARMLEELGYPLLAPIVREHVCLESSHLAGPVTESLVVNYADKRVKHDRVVTLEDRFQDLIVRYAKTVEHRTILRERLALYSTLEERIFDHLSVSPTEEELMQLSLNSFLSGELNHENNEWDETALDTQWKCKL